MFALAYMLRILRTFTFPAELSRVRGLIETRAAAKHAAADFFRCGYRREEEAAANVAVDCERQIRRILNLARERALGYRPMVCPAIDFADAYYYSECYNPPDANGDYC